ncbi:MAG: UDP-N-acetylmuramoyl-L-alanine--D-glutamate ligase [Rudaea sp.]
MDLTGKRVLVMGLGLHGGGLGVTRWLLRQGAQVTVTDLKKPEELGQTLKALQGEPVELILGEHRETDFTSADLIVRNPGVPRESRYLSLARAKGIPVRMEMGLFFERLPGSMEQVVGITGTKGKSTTTLMTGAILKKVNPKTVVAGNIRVSALELLDEIDAETPVVLELSSFQLEEFEELAYSPRVAAITNIYPDHLNRYSDMGEYAAAKANIFRHQGITDYCILNLDSPILTRMRPSIPSRVVWFSRTRPLIEGAYLEGDTITWKWEGRAWPIMRTRELRAPGMHNVENALAAAAIAGAWGASPEMIGQALREFGGVPDRLEVVRELGGITFINDTTATAPAAAITALKTLGGGRGKIWLIAGGSDKGLDYDEMGRTIVGARAGLILLQGTATGKLERAVEAAGGHDAIVATCSDLEKAVEQALRQARPGDTVLLSPGAASFGMFANEFERGDHFRDIVNGLEPPVRKSESGTERG